MTGLRQPFRAAAQPMKWILQHGRKGPSPTVRLAHDSDSELITYPRCHSPFILTQRALRDRKTRHLQNSGSVQQPEIPELPPRIALHNYVKALRPRNIKRLCHTSADYLHIKNKRRRRKRKKSHSRRRTARDGEVFGSHPSSVPGRTSNS